MERLDELLAHVWDHSPFYRETYAAQGIRRRDLPDVSLEDLPTISSADLLEHFDDAVTDGRLRRRELEAWMERDTRPSSLYLNEYLIVHSSGGHNYVPYTRGTWHRMTTAAARLLLPPRPSGKRPQRSAFFFRSDGHHVGPTSAQMASTLAHEVLRLSWFDPVEEIWARLNAFQPDRVHALASALSWLAEWTLQGKLRIVPRSVVVTGERLSPAMRAQVKEAWNADIYDLYAACESLCMAVRQPRAGEFRVLTDLNLLEVVDGANLRVKPGERGRVLLTSLIHTILPLIRFDLRDGAVPGAMGRGAETLVTLDGKTDDTVPVLLSDGGSGVIEVHELVQLELPGVEKLQIVAESPVAIEIRYQSPVDLDAQMDAAFRRLLTRKSAVVEQIKIRRVERILNSMQTFKLQRVVKPEQAMITPTSLTQHDGLGGVRKPVTSVDYGSSIRIAEIGSIDEAFGQIVSKYADHPAALDGDRQITYEELDRLAARVATDLLGRGFDASRPIALLCGHELEMLPLLLGTVRAGGFCMPLDPHLPARRLQAILTDTRPQMLLAGERQRSMAETLAESSVPVLCAENIDPPPMPARARSPSGPACLVYTSGSTGEGKGVVLSHGTILNRARRYGADYDLGPSDRIALLQSYSVNAGVREIFGALLAGATLALYDIHARGIERLSDWLNDTRVSILYAVPTLFRLFLETLAEETFPTVRVVRLGGEPIHSDDVTGFRKHFSARCWLVNGYAATETGTICQYVMDHATRIVAGRVPAGLPVPGAEVTLCDDQGNPAAVALGEIRVAGEMLAAGYWDSRNARVQPFDLPFATGDLGYRLPDGRIFLTGRRDLIVKVHGYRIHLNEIERAVSAVSGIVEAVAVHRPAPRGNSTIVVYYVASGGKALSAAELRRAVASVVPPAAIPTAFIRMAVLPRLPGGKVNRGSLPAQADRAAEPVVTDSGYASETEATLAQIWSEALNVPAVLRGTNFFDSGGDSVSVLMALSRITKEFRVELTIEEFFANAVLTELARTIDTRRARSLTERLN